MELNKITHKAKEGEIQLKTARAGKTEMKCEEIVRVETSGVICTLNADAYTADPLSLGTRTLLFRSSRINITLWKINRSRIRRRFQIFALFAQFSASGFGLSHLLKG